jgi:lipopolysaccharide heptosyltransferase I
MNILIVRLGALGDIIHTIPAVAALRRAFPDTRIDWLVDAKHRAVVELVTVIDRIVALERPTLRAWTDVARRLRQVRYDAAIDFQGLMKSALLARASGATRVIGFSIWHLREKGARPFYSDTDGAGPDVHVILKNLRLLRTLGVTDECISFPLARVQSDVAEQVRASTGERPFALINPGAAWPNKRWPADRYGEVAAFLREVRGLSSVVLWGPGEQSLAQSVVEASAGAAHMAPPTGLGDLLALSRAATLMISGDTGPLHIAAAAGTPTVAIFGPTDPGRNGPWSPDDIALSRFGVCGCHYDRRCHESLWCLADLSVGEVTAAIQQRLARLPPNQHDA